MPVRALGYVIRGKVGFRSGGTEELFEAGDAFPGTHPPESQNGLIWPAP